MCFYYPEFMQLGHSKCVWKHYCMESRKLPVVCNISSTRTESFGWNLNCKLFYDSVFGPYRIYEYSHIHRP